VNILPIQPFKNYEEKTLFDLQTVTFLGFKTDHFIAEPFAFHPAILFSLVDNNGRCPYFPSMMAYPYRWP
jgi:hypothetical protein